MRSLESFFILVGEAITATNSMTTTSTTKKQLDFADTLALAKHNDQIIVNAIETWSLTQLSNLLEQLRWPTIEQITSDPTTEQQQQVIDLECVFIVIKEFPTRKGGSIEIGFCGSDYTYKQLPFNEALSCRSESKDIWLQQAEQKITTYQGIQQKGRRCINQLLTVSAGIAYKKYCANNYSLKTFSLLIAAQANRPDIFEHLLKQGANILCYLQITPMTTTTTLYNEKGQAGKLIFLVQVVNNFHYDIQCLIYLMLTELSFHGAYRVKEIENTIDILLGLYDKNAKYLKQEEFDFTKNEKRAQHYFEKACACNLTRVGNYIDFLTSQEQGYQVHQLDTHYLSTLTELQATQKENSSLALAQSVTEIFVESNTLKSEQPEEVEEDFGFTLL